MPPLLDVRGVSKSFGKAPVLSDVSLSLRSGEIVSVVGENGAGKSTLAKIIAGIVSPDQGEILLNGERITFSSPAEAIEHGIGLVHQELCLAENLTVAENIFLGREPTRRGMIDRATLNASAQSILSRLNTPLAPEEKVSKLSAGHKQMVEIAKALSEDAKILIFDEPTSSLSDADAATLLQVIQSLRAQGVAILYVSHRLAEVLQISDRIVALRDGRNTGEVSGSGATRDAVISLIVGRELRDMYGERIGSIGAPRLELRDLKVSHRHAPCSFVVRRGEIVALAGLVGSGRTEILEGIFGVRPVVSGAIVLDGEECAPRSPSAALESGIALVPEERKESGVILDGSIEENIIISVIGRLAQGKLRAFSHEREVASAFAESLKVRCVALTQVVRELSGGNQQKVVLAKCLATAPKVLLLDEPTRGIDIGARQEIYLQLRRLAGEGLAVLFVSSDLEEVIGLADRVLVVSDGVITGELPRERCTEEAIMSLASPHSEEKAA